MGMMEKEFLGAKGPLYKEKNGIFFLTNSKDEVSVLRISFPPPKKESSKILVELSSASKDVIAKGFRESL